MLDLHGRNGPTLDGSPSTEARDKVASTSSQHFSEDVLSKMLPKLSHMDLTGRVSNKDAAMEAHGGYCDVFVGHVASKHVRHRCIISTGVGKVKVAIKRLRIRLGKDEKLAKSLAREMAIWSRLNHPNILPLLGYLLEKDYPSLVSEWIENGTVRDFVKNNPECDIAHLAFGLAKGLKFIHDQDVVHSDMKADNVLISQSGEPLICDFGISRMLSSSQTFFVSTTHDGAVKGSVRWMAIELHTPDDNVDPKHSKETDVWAYGMTLHEMISKEVPYSHVKFDLHVLLAVMKGELPNQQTVVDPSSSLSQLQQVCTGCWKSNPNDRLTMSQITHWLALLEWRPPQIEYQGAVTSYKTKQANFGRSSVDEQDDRRRPDGMSFPTLTRDYFLAMLQDWWRRNGIKPDARMITIGKYQIDMHQLHTEVLLFGGVVNVRRHDLWSVIAAKMGWLPRIIEPSWTQERFAVQLEVVYEKLLEPFEVEYMAVATKQPLTAQVPGQQGDPSQPSVGSNQLSEPNQRLLSPYVRLADSANVSAEQVRDTSYPKNLIQISELNRSLFRALLRWYMQQQQQQQAAHQSRLWTVSTSPSRLKLASSPAEAASPPTQSSLMLRHERDTLAHSEITLLPGFASETIPSKCVIPDWESVSGAQPPSIQVEEEGIEEILVRDMVTANHIEVMSMMKRMQELMGTYPVGDHRHNAPEQTEHSDTHAVHTLEMYNPTVFPWDLEERLILVQPPDTVVPDLDISSLMTNMTSTGAPSPRAIDGSCSFFAHLQQEDGKADPADPALIPWTYSGSEYGASSEPDFRSLIEWPATKAKIDDLRWPDDHPSAST